MSAAEKWMWRTAVTGFAVASWTACQSLSSVPMATLTAEELANQYAVAGESVRTKFDGKEIVVRGFALAAATLPSREEYEGSISLGGNGGPDDTQVVCWFGQKEAREFAEVIPGSYIKVVGVFNGEGGARLRFCRLVEIITATPSRAN